MTTGATHREAHDGLQGRLLVLMMSMMVLLANEVGKTKTIAKAMDVTSKVPEFPALFVFGDSLLDPGNGVQQEASTSSRLPFHFTANHLPYGRDLPSHLPSGRFSNGLVLSDILAKLIGLPYPPAYLLERDNIMKGTSFATEGAMILNYTSKVLKLYDLGARKFAIVSLPPLGCTPIVQLLFGRRNDTCVSFINKEAQDFNLNLLDMSKQLQATYSNGHFTFLNAYDAALDVITHPSAYGFLNGLQPCCATGPYGGLLVCSRRINSICRDASKYVFWDFAHPTEASDFLLTERFLTGSSPYVQPMNINELSKI